MGIQKFLAYMMRNGASVNRPITKAYSKKHEIEHLEKVLGNPLLKSETS